MESDCIIFLFLSVFDFFSTHVCQLSQHYGPQNCISASSVIKVQPHSRGGVATNSVGTSSKTSY